MAITAAAVKALREKTGLPMMDCKKALSESDGNEDQAIQWLRERGRVKELASGNRATGFGRYGMYLGDKVGAMVELKCESAPVAGNEEFIALANDMAQQLATGPGAETAEELLSQPSPSKGGMTLGEQKDELYNRIRELFKVGRLVRIENACGGYEHEGSRVHGVLLSAEGGDPDQLRDISMHIAAMSPAALFIEELDKAEIETERQALRAAALQEGKPENIVDKMVEGRLRNFYAERVLNEQEFVKAENKESVGAHAKANNIKMKEFVHWVIGEDDQPEDQTEE